jgi:acyl carrier protein
MNSGPILEKVVQTIQASLNTGPTHINRQTRAMDVRGWDSLSHTVILMSLEETFECRLPMDRVFQLKNVGDLVDLLAEILPAEGATLQ